MSSVSAQAQVDRLCSLRRADVTYRTGSPIPTVHYQQAQQPDL